MSRRRSNARRPHREHVDGRSLSEPGAFRNYLDLVCEPPYHVVAMTRLLEDALEAVRQLPADEQDEIAGAMLALAGSSIDGEPVPLTPNERVAIARSKAAAARGQLASEDEIRAVWAKRSL
jgi:hypothetical protein